MRPDDRELDEEIRAHLAIGVKERIDAGEEPEAARLAALRELGYVPAIREEMRRVWFSRWFDAVEALGHDMRLALRSLRRAKGLAATVVVTLALGIGANAAIFSVVRGVLLRPLVNRDEDRLVYIRQSAPGIDAHNMTFSVPELDDLKARVTTISKPADGEEDPRARMRLVAPRFFAVLGIPLLAGRDFGDEDRAGTELVSIVSQSVAQRMVHNGAVLNRRLLWRNPISGKPILTRIIGVVADVDDEKLVRAPAMTLYLAVRQMGVGGRLFVRTSGDPYALVPSVTRVIRGISADQAVEHAATLEDVRAEVLAPERLNAFVFSGFAGIALLIAVVGVAGVLAFSVSARTREFGVRLAVGSAPRHLLTRVLSEGVQIAAIGIAGGAIGGYAIARVAGSYADGLQLPGVLPVVGSAALLIGAAAVASLMPAARAARVDVLQALRSE